MDKLNGIILALVLMAAFCGTASATQFYVNESGWWRDGGAFYGSGTPIQSAVTAADSGDSIFVYNGSYAENVNVNRRLTLEGEGADVVTVTAASSSNHVFKVTADYVSISGFKVTGATAGDRDKAGIYLFDADCCNIYDNTASNNDRGIYLCDSNGNTLHDNTANLNIWRGICLQDSNSNTLHDNTADSNTYYGIYMWGSSNNMLKSNTANSNGYDGILLRFSSSNNTLENNTANSNSLISNSLNGIHLMGSSNHNILTNNTANSNAQYGIHLYYSSGNTLDNNAADLNNHGIYLELEHSSNNNLTGNTANSNTQYGILLAGSNNTLTNNTANSNNWDGIYIFSSSDNTITNNVVSSNGDDGIVLHSSSNHNAITNNTVNSNNGDGIYLDSSSGNNITCNWVQNNTERGFYLYESTGSIISHNNIIENGNCNTTSGGWEWQLYNYQSDPVEAKHNYWGAEMNNTTIDASIYDDEEGGWGEVEFYPFETEPVPCAPGPDRLSPPTITSFAPASPASDTEGATRMFNITLDQTVNVTWLINGTIVQDTNTSVTTASYTNTSAALGVRNVSAVANNANGTDMQTWIWNVAPRVPGDVTGDGVVNIGDAVLLFNWVSFPNERETTYALNRADNADVTGNDVVNIGDATLLFNWVSFPNERGTTYVLK